MSRIESPVSSVFPTLADPGRHRKMAFTGIHVMDAGMIRRIPD